MKHYNKIFTSVLALSILIAPVLGFAAETKIKAGGICSKLDTFSQKLDTNFTQKLDKFTNKKGTRVTNLSGKRVTRDETRSVNLGERDVKVDTRISALMAKADTDAKKAAVTAFDQAVNNAISKRRTTVNTAVASFRTGVDNLINTKFTTIDGSALAFKQSIDAALLTAKNSCASGANNETIRTTLNSSIKVAQSKFKADNKTELSIKADIATLIAARKQSVDGAIALFKVEMEKARADLKLALGVK